MDGKAKGEGPESTPSWPELTLALIDDEVTAAGKGEPRFKLCTVTPEVAREVLALRCVQPQIPHNVQAALTQQVGRHVADMKAGEWVPGASEVVFSADGLLQDGVLRFRAVAESGVPVMFMVVFGARPQARLR